MRVGSYRVDTSANAACHLILFVQSSPLFHLAIVPCFTPLMWYHLALPAGTFVCLQASKWLPVPASYISSSHLLMFPTKSPDELVTLLAHVQHPALSSDCQLQASSVLPKVLTSIPKYVIPQRQRTGLDPRQQIPQARHRHQPSRSLGR